MSERENGIVIGTVVDLNDPEQIGRVKLKLPQYEDQSTAWARISSPMAGKSRGFFFRPEVDDEVLVAFENGDMRRPYVLGALWSKVDTPPAHDAEPKNNWRCIVSRSGHILRFDDTDGSEKIEIIDKSGSHKIVIDSANSKIQIVCDSGDVEVSAPSGAFKVNAQTVEIKASGQMNVQAGAALKIQGATVDIN
jgi:uncharacterized protein involved in type VI secretion and phage assembly